MRQSQEADPGGQSGVSADARGLSVQAAPGGAWREAGAENQGLVLSSLSVDSPGPGGRPAPGQSCEPLVETTHGEGGGCHFPVIPSLEKSTASLRRPLLPQTPGALESEWSEPWASGDGPLCQGPSWQPLVMLEEDPGPWVFPSPGST